MTLHPVTVLLPDPLYRRLEQQAAATQRSVEETLTDFMATAIPHVLDLPSEFEEAIAQLAMLDDTDLWRAARKRLPSRTASRLEHLHIKRQRDGLSDDEAHELQQLMQRYERTIVVRAEATRLLNEHGHDVPGMALTLSVQPAPDA